jgi:hypothetical protein
MSIGSNVNPNFPIPGIDQSSRGFRDNFAVIKQEIEDLQGKAIQLVGDAVGGPVTLDSSNNVAVISVTVLRSNVVAEGNNHAIQYNSNGLISGSEIYFDSGNLRLGIGSSAPRYTVDAQGSAGFVDNIYVVSHSTSNNPAITIQGKGANWGSAVTVSANGYAATGTANHSNLLINTNNINALFIDTNQNVGIGTMLPKWRVDVASADSTIAEFASTRAYADTAIRCMTMSASSTVGVIVDHKLGNNAGGMRIDNTGVVSLHAGENTGGYLSTGTQRITMTPTGKVGINTVGTQYQFEVAGSFKSGGILDISTSGVGLYIAPSQYVGIGNNDPQHELDVIGNVAVSDTVLTQYISSPYEVNINVADGNYIVQQVGGNDVVTVTNSAVITSSVAEVYDQQSVAVDNAPIMIDSWPMREYRSARYLVQVTNGNATDLSEILVVHNTVNAYLNIVGAVDTGSGLGVTFSVNTAGGYVQFFYSGDALGNRVKLQRLYITA